MAPAAPPEESRTRYLFVDHLGSTRLLMNATGTEMKTCDYLRFGKEISTVRGLYPQPGGPNDIKFTSKERDAETGLDYFLARYYSSAQGRFTSPDEFKGGIVDAFTGRDIENNTALPYADITDPQTLNKYAYVRNNPLRYTDPDGHCGLEECIQNVADAFRYVKSVAYIKIEGGVGLGAEVKAGPIKMEIEGKRVSEVRLQESGNTKTSVIEIGGKVEVGPVKAGLAATGEQLLAKGDQMASPGEKREWHPTLGVDLGKNGKTSGWDIGVGASVGVGLQGGFEIGVNGQKIVNDIRSLTSPVPPPPPPKPPSAPGCSETHQCP